ncbi:MAG: ATP-binding protein [Flavobacteriales bacterium]|nr:ATP-binding protein [Flavobacteriales bacterium]
MTKPQLTSETKEAIGKALMAAYKASGFESRAKYARSVDLSSSDFSNIEHEKWKQNDRLLSVQKWLRLARTIGFHFGEEEQWVTARTATYITISKQLEACQKKSMASIFCDMAGLGKSHVCKEYAATHRNAFYVNGGNYPNRWRFVRALAQAIGLDAKGTAEDVLQDVVFYLKSLQNPLLIIDEAGDMDNSTYRLLKRMYNELEFHCGFYMVGAPDLRKRIDSSIRLRRNSFEEVYSRFGGRYLDIVPADPIKQRAFLESEIIQVCTANGVQDPETLNRVVSSALEGKSRGLRYARIQIMKQRLAA